MLKRLPAFVALTALGLEIVAGPAAANDTETCERPAGDASIVACTRVITAGGKNLAWAYNNRGNAYVEKGDYDREISNYNEAIRINPTDANA